MKTLDQLRKTDKIKVTTHNHTAQTESGEQIYETKTKPLLEKMINKIESIDQKVDRVSQTDRTFPSNELWYEYNNRGRGVLVEEEMEEAILTIEEDVEAEVLLMDMDRIGHR